LIVQNGILDVKEVTSHQLYYIPKTMVSKAGKVILISLEPPKNKENVIFKNLKLSSKTPKYGTLHQTTQLT